MIATQENYEPQCDPLRTEAEYLAHTEEGIDITLIQWMLSLTPTERMQVLRQNLHAIAQLRNATTRS